MSDDVRYHRRARKVWLSAAAFWSVVYVLLSRSAPQVLPWVVSSSSWIWCVAIADYHHGWLRAHLSYAILDTLRAGPGTAMDICHRIGWQAGTIHPELARLERHGRIDSGWWGDVPGQRRRWYGLPDETRRPS
jgi:hypothetical protein